MASKNILAEVGKGATGYLRGVVEGIADETREGRILLRPIPGIDTPDEQRGRLADESARLNIEAQRESLSDLPEKKRLRAAEEARQVAGERRAAEAFEIGKQDRAAGAARAAEDQARQGEAFARNKLEADIAQGQAAGKSMMESAFQQVFAKSDATGKLNAHYKQYREDFHARARPLEDAYSVVTLVLSGKVDAAIALANRAPNVEAEKDETGKIWVRFRAPDGTQHEIEATEEAFAKFHSGWTDENGAHPGLADGIAQSVAFGFHVAAMKDTPPGNLIADTAKLLMDEGVPEQSAFGAAEKAAAVASQSNPQALADMWTLAFANEALRTRDPQKRMELLQQVQATLPQTSFGDRITVVQEQDVSSPQDMIVRVDGAPMSLPDAIQYFSVDDAIIKALNATVAGATEDRKRRIEAEVAKNARELMEAENRAATTREQNRQDKLDEPGTYQDKDTGEWREKPSVNAVRKGKGKVLGGDAAEWINLNTGPKK